MKKVILTSLTVLTLGLASVSPIRAEDTDQDQSADADLEQNAECDQIVTGAYGQNICIIDQDQEVDQEQEQEIAYVDEDGEIKGVVKEHEPVDAALDFKTRAVFSSTVLSAAAAFLLKVKNRLA